MVSKRKSKGKTSCARLERVLGSGNITPLILDLRNG